MHGGADNAYIVFHTPQPGVELLENVAGGEILGHDGSWQKSRGVLCLGFCNLYLPKLIRENSEIGGGPLCTRSIHKV